MSIFRWPLLKEMFNIGLFDYPMASTYRPCSLLRFLKPDVDVIYLSCHFVRPYLDFADYFSEYIVKNFATDVLILQALRIHNVLSIDPAEHESRACMFITFINQCTYSNYSLIF